MDVALPSVIFLVASIPFYFGILAMIEMRVSLRMLNHYDVFVYRYSETSKSEC